VGPTYYPILGSTVEAVLATDTLPDFFLKYSRQNNFKYTWPNPTLGVGMFRLGAFVVVTPAAVKHILKDNFEKYEKTELLREPVKELLGSGIFTSDGPEWKFHRKIAVQM
jgi:cytochrome P450